MRLTIDARFAKHSGIGRHISSVLAHWPGTPGLAIVANAADSPPDWQRTVCQAGMYTLAEQGPALRQLARAADITWFPHFAHPWRCPGRWVCTVHDVIHLALPELFPGRVRRFAARALLADVRDRAAAVCFVSRFTRDEFHRLVGAPRGTEHIVGNGVDPSWSRPAPAPPGWDGRPYVVAVGNVKPHKGLRHLLQAMQDPRLAELDLVLIGRVDGLRTVDHAAVGLVAGLGARCRWTGPVGDDELRAWVSHARVLAFPSLYEGFGIPPLEAMAAGVPVVASRIPAVEEVCAASAWLVPPADADALADGLLHVAQDEELRTRLIHAGRSLATQWTWSATARSTWQALQTAAGRPLDHGNSSAERSDRAT